MSPIERRVIAITACILHIDPRSISPADSFVLDLGAESIQLVQLAGHFEKDFGVVLDDECMLQCTTIAEVAKAIASACALANARSGMLPHQNASHNAVEQHF